MSLPLQMIFNPHFNSRKLRSAAPVLTQILTSDSVEVEVNAEIITRIPKVWNGDAIGTVDDAGFIIIL